MLKNGKIVPTSQYGTTSRDNGTRELIHVRYICKLYTYIKQRERLQSMIIKGKITQILKKAIGKIELKHKYRRSTRDKKYNPPQIHRNPKKEENLTK